VQVRAVGRREQRPFGVFHHAAHEQVGNPVRGVHVVRAAAVVAGVLAQFEEFLDVEVPAFQIGAHRALALAALIHRDGGVIDHLQEGHDALALAVGALDVRAQRAHRRPVVAQTAGELGQQRVFLDRLEDAVEVVGHRREVARRQLRAQRGAVEQRRRRAHEVEAGQQLIELDGARFAVDFVHREAHGDAHEEHLRQFDAAVADVQEVAVVQRLQAEVVEAQVVAVVERGAQLGQIELRQLGIEQFGFDAQLDVAREVLGVGGGHCALRRFLAQHFGADGVQQQAGGDVAVGRVVLDQRAGGQDGRLAHFVDRHAVVQIGERGVEDGAHRHDVAQIFATVLDQRAQAVAVERHAAVAVDHVQHRLFGRRIDGVLLLRTFGGTLLAVEHVGAGDVMLRRAHQRQFDLILDVFDMEGAAVRQAAHQRIDDRSREHGDLLAHTRRRSALPAVHCQKGLGHRDRYLGRLERHDGAVATDDLVIGMRHMRRHRFIELNLVGAGRR
jgi:hypothetical protein